MRGVQAERKDLDLDVADRIRVRYRADGELLEAIMEWDTYIRRETLALELAHDHGLEGEAQFKAGGSPVRVAVERAERSAS